MAARLSLLDPLRGFAALMVVLFHARLLLVPQWLDAIAGKTQLIENSYLWVDLFFIMSGLVMAHVYAEALARRDIGVGRFLWLRLTRIYPLYLLTLLIAIGWELYKLAHQIGFYAGPLFRKWGLEGAPAFASRFTPYEALPSTFVLLQTPVGYGLTWNFATWSLSVEWISYLLFPLLVPLVLRRGRWRWLLSVLGMTLLTALVLKEGTLDLVSGAPAVCRGVAGFAVGAGLLRQVEAAHESKVARSDLLLLAVFVLPFVLLHFPLTPLRTLLVFASYVLLVWCAASQVARSSPGFRLLQNRLTTQLGDLSYSIYLWHGVLLLSGVQLLHVLAPQRVERWYANTRPLAGVLAVLGLLALVWAVSWLTYHYVERPARRRLRQLFPA